MGKLFVRIDDRLIHGQIVTAWAKSLAIGSIVAVDNSLANNDMIKDILLMGIPKEYGPKIVSEEEAIELLQTDVNMMLITRFAKSLGSFVEHLRHCEHVNIGNSAKQSDSVYLSKGFGVGQVLSFSQEDVEVLDQLVEMGISVFSQQMPSDKATEWTLLKKDLKRID